MNSTLAEAKPVEVSIVIPAKNEADNVEPLISEILAALDGVVEFEIVYVDDGSTDNTPAGNFLAAVSKLGISAGSF